MPYPNLVRDSRGFNVELGEFSLIAEMDYNADGSLLYAGYAPPGSVTSDSNWMIFKFTYTNGNLSSKRFAQGKNDFISKWDDRTTYTYA